MSFSCLGTFYFMFLLLCGCKFSTLMWLLLFCINQRKIKTFSLCLSHSPTLSLSNFCLCKWWVSLAAFEARCMECSLCETSFLDSLFDITERWSRLIKYTYVPFIIHSSILKVCYVCWCNMPVKVSKSQILVSLSIKDTLAAHLSKCKKYLNVLCYLFIS